MSRLQQSFNSLFVLVGLYTVVRGDATAAVFGVLLLVVTVLGTQPGQGP